MSFAENIDLDQMLHSAIFITDISTDMLQQSSFVLVLGSYHKLLHTP